MALIPAWEDLRLFLCVAEQGSFSAAARHLKLGQATLSRRIAEVEVHLGEALFFRGSQGVSLTATGQRLLAPAQRMAEWASEAQHCLQPEQPLQGTVKITAPPGIALDLLAPMAAAIREKFPLLQLEIISTLKFLNLSRGDADIALRSVAPDDPDLLCLDEISAPIRAYATSKYLRSLPPDYRLEDLAWICWAPQYDEMYVNQELKRLIPNFKAAFSSDDYNVQYAACLAGAGVMMLPHVQHRFTSLGQLEALPFDFGERAVGRLFMVCHKRSKQLAKVCAVSNFISEQWQFMRQQQTT